MYRKSSRRQDLSSLRRFRRTSQERCETRGAKMLSQKGLEDIGKAIEGLEYPSESDQAFEIVQNVVFEQKPQEMSADAFFKDLHDSEDWPRFANLRKTLEAHLLNLSVFR